MTIPRRRHAGAAAGLLAAALLTACSASTVPGSGRLDGSLKSDTSTQVPNTPPKLGQRWSTTLDSKANDYGHGLVVNAGIDGLVGGTEMFFDQTVDGRVFGLAADSGRIVWKADPGAGNTGALALAGNRVLFYGTSGVTALDAATGKTDWVNKHGELTNSNTLSAAQSGQILGYAGSDGLQGLDLQTGAARWTNTSLSTFDGLPVALGSRFFVAADPNTSRSTQVSAVDAATGRTDWQVGVPAQTNDDVAVYTAGNLVLVQLTGSSGVNAPSTLTALDPATGKLLWTANTAGYSSTVSRPVAVSGQIVLAGQGGVRAYSASTGKIVYTTPMDGGGEAVAVVRCGSLVCGQGIQTLAAVGPTGAIEQTVSSPLGASLCAGTYRAVYVATYGVVYRYS